ncbi:hypothetical protein [Lacinutrix sp. Bg11-31]|uniref:hypothetical protein n=1 Tax=Lacinutrix sp. Bg11-31 TaxID=2057808 RepID=UPI000C318F0C|nr:hypothetical protein [Lacinutrix sp. Bg11-31]AUC82960.1 hypothetical protein CW733_12825 [Lacinutrix sp. Bg11-31]
MSQELPSNKNSNEEVDLIVFFNLIGNALTKVVSFFTSVIKAVFSVAIHTVKIFINSWKIILGVIVVFTIIGYVLEQTKNVSYQSEMLVEPFYGSKYQLVTNIKYFNALIAERDYDALSNIFVEDSISLDVKNILGFKVEPGPETENDRILQYQGFMQRLDSVRKEEMTFDDYIENRSLYSGDLFLITAYSSQKDIFKNLEKGVASAFTNQFSAEAFIKKEQLRELQKQNLKTQLQEIDSLKTFYIKVRTDESKTGSKKIDLGGISLSNDTRSTTREYELLEKENIIRDQLKSLDQQKIEEDKLYAVISSFQGVGEIKRSWRDKYSLIFPALAFVLLCIFYLIFRVVNYAKNYED